jgi:hypothetical protein
MGQVAHVQMMVGWPAVAVLVAVPTDKDRGMEGGVVRSCYRQREFTGCAENEEREIPFFV